MIDNYLKTFFHGQSSSSVLSVVHRAHQIIASTPPELQPDRLLATLTHVDGNVEKIDAYPVRSSACFYPLTTPHYPIVTRYPKFIVDFHIRERERIREEEKEYLRQRYVYSQFYHKRFWFHFFVTLFRPTFYFPSQIFQA